MTPYIPFYDYRDPECPDDYDPDAVLDAWEADGDSCYEDRRERE